MVTSLTPEYQRERAHAMPAGPAPTIRIRVLDGKDILGCELRNSEQLGGAGGWFKYKAKRKLVPRHG
jgi:hypothetical protein